MLTKELTAVCYSNDFSYGYPQRVEGGEEQHGEQPRIRDDLLAASISSLNVAKSVMARNRFSDSGFTPSVQFVSAQG